MLTRFFECNYGTSGTPFDKMFGTFRDKLKETGPSTYRGGSEEKVDTKTASAHDAKASLTTPPDAGFVIYMGVNCAIWAILWLAVRQEYQLHTVNPHYLALLVSAGPVVLAQVGCLCLLPYHHHIFHKVMANLTENTKRSMFYPFHKDGWKVIKYLPTTKRSDHHRSSAGMCSSPAWFALAQCTRWCTCFSGIISRTSHLHDYVSCTVHGFHVIIRKSHLNY